MTPGSYDDVMEVGSPDRPPRQLSPRSKRIAAAAAALAVTGYGGWQLSDGSGNQPTALATSAAPVTPAPTEAATTPPTAGPRAPVLGVRTHTRLLVAGAGSVTDFDVDSGSRRTVELAGVVTRAEPVTGGLVVLREEPQSGSPPVRTAYFVSDDRTTVTKLGAARSVVPAASPDMIWLTDPRAGGSPGRMTRVDLTGRVDITTDLGADRRAVRETAFGMVTVLDKRFSRALELFDWQRGSVSRQFFVGIDLVVVDSSPTHVAYTVPSCARTSCRLRVADLAEPDPESNTVDVYTPPGWTTELAAFAPDGPRIAMIGRVRRDDGTTSPAMLMADADTGAAARVRGLRTGPDRYSRLAWSPDGRWLFGAAARPGASMLAYRSGEFRVRFTPDPRGPEAADAGSVAAFAAF